MPGQGKTVSGGIKEVMTIKEVAEYLGVHTSTIYKYAQQGTIPAFKIGSDWRFSTKHIDWWIDAKMNTNGNGK
jgi:excisionase family DNA binding protein